LFKAGDPYQAHCEATTFSLVNTLGLTPEQYTLCYNRHLDMINGCNLRLTPCATITEKKYSRGRCDLSRLCIDCLETLEENQITAARTFLQTRWKIVIVYSRTE